MGHRSQNLTTVLHFWVVGAIAWRECDTFCAAGILVFIDPILAKCMGVVAPRLPRIMAVLKAMLALGDYVGSWWLGLSVGR